jgi:hypothetical protein
VVERANGSYVLTAVATDNRGATKSATRNVTVADNLAPSVSLTSPAAAAKFTLPASITMTASASDSDGTVAKVEFYADSTLVGSDTTSPYSVIWSGAPEGTHSLTAVAYDNKGGMTVSSAKEVLVTASALPDTLMFTPAISSSLDRYVLEIYTAGADASSATPVATFELGTPNVVNNEVVVDVRSVMYPLPAGSYFAVVSADTADGLLRSAPSPVFTR